MEPQVSPENAGRELRTRALKRKASDINLQPNEWFPLIFGVIVDFPIGGSHVGTLVSIIDGGTSLYTTTTFGIIGGGAHEKIREASLGFVKFAESAWSNATPTQDFSYPSSEHVRFYFLGYDEVRLIESTIQSLGERSDPNAPLWYVANHVLSELRQTTSEAM